jgi:hypothetical protein
VAFKIFAGGATLSAADLNDYLMEQAVVVCTSSTRPSSPHEGMTIYESDTNLYKIYDGSGWVTLLQPSAWTTYTPVVKGSASGSSPATLDAASTSRYCRHGRQISWHGFAKLDALLTSGITGTVYFDLPVAADATFGWTIGPATGYDASANVGIHGVCALVSSTQMSMQYIAGTGPSGTPTSFEASAAPWAWTTDDNMTWSVVYQAAT